MKHDSKMFPQKLKKVKKKLLSSCPIQIMALVKFSGLAKMFGALWYLSRKHADALYQGN